MEGGARVAAAVGVGYLLGRSRKMRWALMLAAAGAAGRMTSNPSELLDKGKKLLNSADLSQVTESLGADLGQAAKSAAVTAVSNKLDSVSDNIHDRSEQLRNPAPADEDEGESDADEPEGDDAELDEEADLEEEPPEEEPENEESEDEEPDEESEEDLGEEEPPPRRKKAAASSRGSGGRSRSSSSSTSRSRR